MYIYILTCGFCQFLLDLLNMLLRDQAAQQLKALGAASLVPWCFRKSSTNSEAPYEGDGIGIEVNGNLVIEVMLSHHWQLMLLQNVINIWYTFRANRPCCLSNCPSIWFHLSFPTEAQLRGEILAVVPTETRNRGQRLQMTVKVCCAWNYMDKILLALIKKYQNH